MLETIVPGDAASGWGVENQLVQKGLDFVPALQQLLATRRTTLVQLKAPVRYLNYWDTPEAAKLAGQIVALDQAIFRLTNTVNPRGAIVDWAHTLKYADGRVFTREFLPIPVIDVETDRLQRLRPTRRFYVAYFPGYPGGVQPPEDVLRQYELPRELRRVTLFVTDQTGWVYPIYQPPDTGMSMAVMPVPYRPTHARIGNPQEAAYIWLRLTTAFWWWNEAPLPFLPISDADITSASTNYSRLVHGVINVAKLNGNSGRITLDIRFDVDGGLVGITETPEVTLAPLPQRSMTRQ